MWVLGVVAVGATEGEEGSVNRINGLNGRAAAMQTRLGWRRGDSGKAGVGAGGKGISVDSVLSGVCTLFKVTTRD